MKTKRLVYQNSPAASLLIASAIGCLCAVVLLLLLLFSAAMLLLRQEDPFRFLLPSALVILGISALVGGGLSARLCRDHSVLSALLCGVALGLLTLLLSLIIPFEPSSMSSLPLQLLTRVLPLLAASLGAFTIRKHKKRPSHHRRRR